MPKFYVSDGVERTIIEADSALQACFRSIKHRFKGIPVNGYYKVSEQGYDKHDDDIVFKSDEVLHALLEIMDKLEKKKRKNPEKDEEGD